ncbi:hypothetical protein AB0I28_38595 [Phytomonospora sp. NPDC050363]|uniref:hypothetical protein n=1 Tax=Phytomonospora sp. NPDC050363 TaxID=3155642 RepID=UPI00340FD9B9
MTNIRLDAAELRRVAELALGDLEFDYRPKLLDISEALAPNADVMSDRHAGYIYGPGGIGAHHDHCVGKMIEFFDNLDAGLIAVTNVLASVSEDFTETDVDSETSISTIMQYFTPPPSS